MTTTLLNIIIFFFIGSQLIYSQWNLQQPVTGLTQNKVCYAGENNIYIICEQGKLLFSKNGGQSWENFQFPTLQNLNGIEFITDEYSFIVGDGGKIFKTEDGWINYTDISIADYFNIKEVKFQSEENGIAVGSKMVFIDGKHLHLPSVHRTTDGGMSWIEIHFDFQGKLNSVIYLPKGKVLAVGNNGLFLRSTDNGINWTEESFQIESNFNSINICSNFITTICGDEGIILYSTDLGYGWTEIRLPDSYNLKHACYNKIDGWVAAGNQKVRIDGKTFYMAAIISFHPGTNQWSEELLLERGNYNCVSFCNANQAMAVGDSGIIAIFNFDPNSNSDKYTLSENFYISQNYPNPFNPKTVIKYSIPADGFVSLIIYDALGREITKLLNEEKSPGNYQIEWNAANYPSGIYFYKIHVLGIDGVKFNNVKKMLLVK
jgi:photosystem II stability/assembly factor-like uncharacterized protein